MRLLNDLIAIQRQVRICIMKSFKFKWCVIEVLWKLRVMEYNDALRWGSFLGGNDCWKFEAQSDVNSEEKDREMNHENLSYDVHR